MGSYVTLDPSDKKDNKVFSLYRSMIATESEKIKSAVLKYIIMFVVIIPLTGLMFKFVFLNIILGMGKPEVPVMEASIPDKVKKTEVERVISTNEYKIIGIVNDHYIVKTHK